MTKVHKIGNFAAKSILLNLFCSPLPKIILSSCVGTLCNQLFNDKPGLQEVGWMMLAWNRSNAWDQLKKIKSRC